MQPQVYDEQLAAIETLLQYLGTKFDPVVLKTRRAFLKVGPLEYGQVCSDALAALKRASDWRTCNQLLDDILSAHRLELTDAQRRHCIQKLREALHALKRERAVVCKRPGARLTAAVNSEQIITARTRCSCSTAGGQLATALHHN